MDRPVRCDRHEPTLPDSIVGDDFRLIRQVGFGGYARVFLAEQLSVGKRMIAVKVLHDLHTDRKGAISALKREASYLAQLRSPCFPRVIRTGMTSSGAPYFAMEFIAGKTIESIVREKGALPLDRVAHVLQAVFEGLAEMHARDIIHRDLKTGNIMVEDSVSGRWRVCLLDLGSAKPAYEGAKGGDAAGSFGSPPYLAPETVTDKITSELSDIYSLGAVAYEMLTGIRPIHIKDTRPEAYVAYLKSQSPIPTYRIGTIQPQVPESIEAVVTKALDRDPRKRFLSVKEFESAFTEALAESAGQNPQDKSSSAVSRLADLLPLRFKKG